MGRSRGDDAGWKVAGYVAEKLVGYGATAQVWSGRVARTGAPVALKVVRATDDCTHRVARTEAGLLSTLDHPHLLRLHELIVDGDDVILVLDLAEGGSLADVLERRSVLAAGEVVTALAPIAAALAYAHGEGIVHGDVSAANILFTADGRPLLADLGVATMFGSVEEVQSTLGYLDPAVAAGGPCGPPSDVFMLGAVALHALTGRPPWTGPDAQTLIETAAGGEIDGLEPALAAIPDDVAAVVRRALSAIPHDRGSAAEFALDLRHAATPVAVELAAGRTRSSPIARVPPVAAETVSASADTAGHLWAASDDPVGSAPGGYRPRHSGPLPVLGPSDGEDPTSVAAVDPDADYRPTTAFDRPDFTRPRSSGTPTSRQGALPPVPAGDARRVVSDSTGAVSLTRQVRSRNRSLEPVPPRRFDQVRRRSGWTAGVLLAIGLAALIPVGWSHLTSRAHADAVTASTAPGARPTPTASYTAQATGPAGSASGTSTVEPSIEPSVAATIAVPAKPPVATSGASSKRRGAEPTSPTPVPTTRPPVPTGGRSAPARPAGELSRWTAVLHALDGHRERAFARADASELARVYVAGSLLIQDRAALRRVDPPGCVLIGLSTRFTVQAVTVAGDAVRIHTMAAVASATSRCGGKAVGRTAAQSSAAMVLELRSTAGGYRISSVHDR